MPSASLRNVIVVGGSYVGCKVAQELAAKLPVSHRVVLVEPHSHFHHLFAFPRFAVVPNHEHKAFIPYTSLFSDSSIPDPSIHEVVRGRVTSVHKTHVVVSESSNDPAKEREIRFDFLVIATGTRLPSPGTMEHDHKQPSVDYFKQYQLGLKAAQSVVIVGGGAVGVQMACDIKEVYPQKEVTLVQSRDRVMPKFHPKFHDIIKERLDELGVQLITGSRVNIPNGRVANGETFEVVLNSGQSLQTQLVIPAIGQTPNTDLLSSLHTSDPKQPLINPQNGFINVHPTLQLANPLYPHIFALGDVADTGMHKAARPGAAQAVAVTANILSLIRGEEAVERITGAPAGIHMTLGLTRNVVFRNPDPASDPSEPWFKLKDDGVADMGIEGVWERRGVKVTGPGDYHL